jgi:ABC-type hemin transport system substrate-binding protein
MGIGESSRNLFVEENIKKVFSVLEKAINNVGSVIEINKKTFSLIAKTRYGLQSVKVRISLVPENDGVIINFNGAGDDIWGGGARKGIDKIITEFETLI